MDQSREMNAHLSESMPSVAAIEGTATAIPAADSSFDAVFIAQVWHHLQQIEYFMSYWLSFD